MTDYQMEVGATILIIMVAMMRDPLIAIPDKDIRRILQRKCVNAAIDIDKNKKDKVERKRNG